MSGNDGVEMAVEMEDWGNGGDVGYGECLNFLGHELFLMIVFSL